MRKIDFTEYQIQRRAFLKHRAALGSKRAASNRFRDREERELLIRLDRSRWQSWLATGRLKKLGHRRYQLCP